MKTKKISADSLGFVRIAAAAPPLRVGDVDYNVHAIMDFARRADAEGARIMVFPELGITGYTAGDLFRQRLLLEQAALGLDAIIRASKKIKTIVLVGLPISHEGKLFNVAAVVHCGRLWGFVPKLYIPGYKEFYEERWFASGRDRRSPEVVWDGERIPFGTDLIFRFDASPGSTFAIEICEDLWVPIPPSSRASLAGAALIFNLSASPELVAKADYRRALVSQQSARTITGYTYASSGVHESTTDLVFGGHALIVENGTILVESRRFIPEGEMIVADIDREHIMHDREATTSFGEGVHEAGSLPFRTIEIPAPSVSVRDLMRPHVSAPFIPDDPALRDRRVQEIFSIQTAGLAERLRSSGIRDVVIGVSGGLDSTLALLAAAQTFSLMKLSLKNIHAYTMPGFATSDRTKSNAYRLCEALGIAIEEIDITAGTHAHFRDIGHDPRDHSLVFQNAQARYRTMLLMNAANQHRAIVVGTGDLSEIALGWNTFSGDQLSHYNVNAGIPKTLVRYVVEWANDQPFADRAKKTLEDILATPISPELVRASRSGISQKTEEIIGPYALHDFFLYHFLRWGSSPSKILFLAQYAFAGRYTDQEIKKWLRVFIERFFANQWKRSVMPDGPKVGSVALSPRGDWRMPSDADVRAWLKDLEEPRYPQ